MTNKEEAISRKEAIKYLKWIRPINPYSLDRIKVQQSIDLAINALKFIDEHSDSILNETESEALLTYLRREENE